MKKIVTGALALFLMIGAAEAQSKDSTRKHHREAIGAKKMAKLDLSAEQQARLRAINEARRAELQSLKADAGKASAEQKAEREAISKKYREQAAAVYTPAQKEQLAKMKAEHKSKAKASGKKKGKMGHRKGGAVLQELNLTEDQKAKIAELNRSSKNEFESLKKDQSLSVEQKKEKMKALRAEQAQKMKSLLTEEQAQKLERMKSNRKAAKK